MIISLTALSINSTPPPLQTLEVEEWVKQMEGHYQTVSYIRQHNHCGSSLKELCHHSSVNFCSLMMAFQSVGLHSSHQKSAETTNDESSLNGTEAEVGE